MFNTFLGFGLVFTAIMLVPSLSAGITSGSNSLELRLFEALSPLPSQWFALLPTAFMLAVFVTLSRFSMRGEVRVWQASGLSVWPMVRSIGFLGLSLGFLVATLNIVLPQPVGDYRSDADAHLRLETEGTLWTRPQNLGELESSSDQVTFFADNRLMIAGQLTLLSSSEAVLMPVRIFDGDQMREFAKLQAKLLPNETRTSSPWLSAENWAYPFLVLGAGLLMLPLGLAMDGRQPRLVLIVASALLALNTLFLILMTNALAKAGFWPDALFFPSRAVLVLGLALLVILIREERAF